MHNQRDLGPRAPRAGALDRILCRCSCARVRRSASGRVGWMGAGGAGGQATAQNQKVHEVAFIQSLACVLAAGAGRGVGAGVAQRSRSRELGEGVT